MGNDGRKGGKTELKEEVGAARSGTLLQRDLIQKNKGKDKEKHRRRDFWPEKLGLKMNVP